MIYELSDREKLMHKCLLDILIDCQDKTRLVEVISHAYQKNGLSHSMVRRYCRKLEADGFITKEQVILDNKLQVMYKTVSIDYPQDMVIDEKERGRQIRIATIKKGIANKERKTKEQINPHARQYFIEDYADKHIETSRLTTRERKPGRTFISGSSLTSFI